ncbi:MAG TPA: beta-ketoacyl synthase N-terminal-like domain-containing protein, partial [Thermoanaerobaculia bacterium]|nr:beta-ketoacyl synthase N-terminal-like domain-containing protein [Thermoanaerobaculia bacterium]
DGKDCITEIPSDRWNWRDFFSEDRSRSGRHYSKWGGFISGVDEFDPLFFNISPLDAEVTDPQERLFLQHAWMAIEDAGYTRASLQVPQEGDLPGQVGVYAGVMYNEYQLLGADAAANGKRIGIPGSTASIANRVSHILDLHGPSMTLDTMCSSSLTAIHLACEDLRHGRTSLAIAGGVNVSIHPNKYLVLSQGQFISSEGHCQSFGRGGDGYIPGEGVGVVVLKRLSDAKRDGDHIYGIIRGSALNHGGRTNGYTVPNPQAQASVIARALAESRIDARHVSYLEAHGTGTTLGDPIEIAALNKAFGQATQDKTFCRIGSVKSNIGHCESAAGIAGLTKVLLQMQHRQIVPSLHSAELNPHIDFENSPFVVNQTLREWEQPVIGGRRVPRIAGLSSFGAGGSNAHIVIEEYEAAPAQAVAMAPVIIVLSARTLEQLRRKASDLLDFVESRRGDVDLVEVAYTLQVGREAMEWRLGLVVGSIDELVEKLRAYAAGEPNIEDLYRGVVSGGNESLSLFSGDTDMQQTVDRWIASRKLSRLLELWVRGLSLDWSRLYGEIRPRRISLPVYPFARERYWIDTAAPAGGRREDGAAVLHPLLHSNVSRLNEQRYRTTFTGEESFVADHRVTGRKVVPGAVCLEMARAAIENALPEWSGSALDLRNVVWTQPIVVEQPQEVFIALTPVSGDRVEITISSHNDEIVHCQGTASVAGDGAGAVLDLAQLEAEMDREPWEPAILYSAFEGMGLGYGPAFRAMTALYRGSGQLLARLRLPESLVPAAEDYVLHPSLLDGAMQAAAGLVDDVADLSGEARLPFALESLRIVAPCRSEMAAWVRYAPGSAANDRVVKVDIDLCDERGAVCARMRGLSSRVASRPQEQGRQEEPAAAIAQSDPIPAAGSVQGIAERMQEWLRAEFSTLMKLPAHRIDPQAALEKYGIDSILAMKLTSQLEKSFGSLSKTLFFEYQTIAALAGYFVRAFPDAVRTLLASGEPAGAPAVLRLDAARPRPIVRRKHDRFSARTGEAGDIAIVGLAGRYPQAANLRQFWRNLQNGRDSITEIPSDRWDHSLYFDPDPAQAGRSYSKWGGFLTDVDKFDPLFFNISPREASLLDPQERLFLETAWETIEDAGYSKESLSGRRVGVFVGVMWGQYELFGADVMAGGGSGFPGSSYSSIANRVSYFFDFHGPSMAVDTMCSSSLTAIHLACKELWSGDIEAAIAGGVNLSIHPYKYLSLSQGKFVASDGRCRSFGAGGDGYVPGEGVGAVLLKPLAHALDDGDQIYAVIRASALNHGGKTNGYTVPNPVAQGDLILEALRKASVDPRTLSYIETHGTGTSLGDPIEITGLMRAFESFTQDKQFCAIGSVKSNIGHLESAAGIAALTKALLQLRHAQLVPSLHAEPLNPHIDFGNSPFYVQTRLSEWGRDAAHPRRLAVSSFGAGGSNAHLVLEEFVAPPAESGAESGPQLFVLSAKDPEA